MECYEMLRELCKVRSRNYGDFSHEWAVLCYILNGPLKSKNECMVNRLLFRQ